jgi:hypothetical protein
MIQENERGEGKAEGGKARDDAVQRKGVRLRLDDEVRG